MRIQKETTLIFEWQNHNDPQSFERAKSEKATQVKKFETIREVQAGNIFTISFFNISLGEQFSRDLPCTSNDFTRYFSRYSWSASVTKGFFLSDL